MEGNINKRMRKAALALAFSVIICAQTTTTLALDLPVTEVIPMGNTVGINLHSNGLIVVAVAEIQTETGKMSPAADSGITAGDIITHINGSNITSAEEFREAINSQPGKTMSVKVLRAGKEMQFSLNPVINAEGKNELGLWLRDSVAGIGTLTFYDPKSGVFGSLGHCVSDIDTGVIIPMKSGSITRSTVKSIIRGESGSPGQLQGEFDLNGTIGNLYANTEQGLFGTMGKNKLIDGKKPMPVASESEIQIGEATILANVAGDEVVEYKIEISRIYTGAEAAGRSMMITVIDERLLEQTGGIVQGMSGSPILQNGKIIGAVTHVLIKNPTRGYGISIESMLNTAFATQSNQKAA